jgi:hypothetical protein
MKNYHIRFHNLIKKKDWKMLLNYQSVYMYGH